MKKLFFITLNILFITSTSCSSEKTQKEKLEIIAKKMQLVENLKTTLIDFRIKTLVENAHGADSLELTTLIKRLTDDEIEERVYQAIEEVFTKDEIDDVYNFIKTTAFQKFISVSIQSAIQNEFKDIELELQKILEKQQQIHKEDFQSFEPIPFDGVDGFYETLNYTHVVDDKDLLFKDFATMTFEDVKELKKVLVQKPNGATSFDLILRFNERGRKKFYELTKMNTGKPVAVVINKEIVMLPIVQTPINSGKVQITGDYNSEQIDKMITKINRDIK